MTEISSYDCETRQNTVERWEVSFLIMITGDGEKGRYKNFHLKLTSKMDLSIKN